MLLIWSLPNPAAASQSLISLNEVVIKKSIAKLENNNFKKIRKTIKSKKIKKKL
jgi:hypothetical protein